MFHPIFSTLHYPFPSVSPYVFLYHFSTAFHASKKTLWSGAVPAISGLEFTAPGLISCYIPSYDKLL